MTLLNRQQIMAMIPHSGSMCLLDEVLAWDDTSLRCLSRRYRQPDNPMRRPNGELGAATGIEIAAQSLALHCRLLAPSNAPPQRGYLVSLRDVRLHPTHLDAIDADLIIEAERILGNPISATYHFTLTIQATERVTGRATVLLEQAQPGLEPE